MTLKCYDLYFPPPTLPALQRDLISLEKWSIESRMNFNPSKCKIITVSRKKCCLFHYILGGTELTRCNEETDLGIKMSNNLKWDSQVMQVVSRANKMLDLLKRTCYSLTDEQVRKTLYLSLVKSQFELWYTGLVAR